MPPTKRTILAISILCLLMVVPVLVSGAGDPIKSAATGATLVPADMNWINASGSDVLGTTGTIQAQWNFTTWDNVKFPDCYARLYTDHHLTLIGEMKIPNPTSLNKSATKPISYSGLPNGIYYLNLQCQMNKEPFDSINLDIVPIVISNVVSINTRTDGMKQVQNYVTCKDMPGVNCAVWQQTASQGRSWNKSLGVPI